MGDATVTAAERAYKMAGVGPQDIDLAEVHDCFSITEIVDYEDLGFCEKGQGGKFVESGASDRNGKLPVNASGGLISKGRPLGATGVAQMAELYWHLRGEAGGRQVEIKKGYGLQHNVGGLARHRQLCSNYSDQSGRLGGGGKRLDAVAAAGSAFHVRQAVRLGSDILACSTRAGPVSLASAVRSCCMREDLSMNSQTILGGRNA